MYCKKVNLSYGKVVKDEFIDFGSAMVGVNKSIYVDLLAIGEGELIDEKLFPYLYDYLKARIKTVKENYLIKINRV